ncbi:MAG: hypothetical protein P4L53_17705 [Candidatus Obscuribacterales bacterium]|nr:hypothetical protein [Candidatus Obscuribacterales bacterium]
MQPLSKLVPQFMNDLARAYGMAGMYEKSIAERKWAVRYGYADQDEVFLQCDNLFQQGDFERVVAVGEYAESRGEQNPAFMRLWAKAHLEQRQSDKGFKRNSALLQNRRFVCRELGYQGKA